MKHHIDILTRKGEKEKVRFTAGFSFAYGSGVITLVRPDLETILFFTGTGLYLEGQKPNEETLDLLFNTNVGTSFQIKESPFKRVGDQYIMTMLGSRTWYPIIKKQR